MDPVVAEGVAIGMEPLGCYIRGPVVGSRDRSLLVRRRRASMPSSGGSVQIQIQIQDTHCFRHRKKDLHSENPQQSEGSKVWVSYFARNGFSTMKLHWPRRSSGL